VEGDGEVVSVTETIQEILEREVKSAKMLMKKQKSITPMIAVCLKGEMMVFPLIGEKSREKCEIGMS